MHCVALWLGLQEGDTLALRVEDGVGLPENDSDGLPLGLIVSVRLPLPELEGLPLPLPEGVPDMLPLPLPEAEGEGLGVVLREQLHEPLADGVAEGDGDWDGETLRDRLALGEGVPLPLHEAVRLPLMLGDRLREPVRVITHVADAVGVIEAEGVALPEPLHDIVRLDGVPLRLGLHDALGDRLGDAEGEPDGDGVPLGVALRLLGELDGVRVAETIAPPLDTFEGHTAESQSERDYLTIPSSLRTHTICSLVYFYHKEQRHPAEQKMNSQAVTQGWASGTAVGHQRQWGTVCKRQCNVEGQLKVTPPES